MRKLHRLLFLFTASLLLGALISTAPAYACPAVNGIPDFNCDGKVEISVIGDSLVAGFGDTKNQNKGGYITRAQTKLRAVKFNNLGVLGLRTRELLLLLRDSFKRSKNPELSASLKRSDIIILDLGRNDRWLFGPPIETFRNLKRAATQLKRYTKDATGLSPLVVTAVLMLPNRGSQGPWVKELNGYILRGNTLQDPSDLRFDLVSKRLLSKDQIHPTSQGYTALSQTFTTYLTKKLPKRMRQLRPDSDKDGLSDVYESLRFGTDPSLPDTDGDGKLDGEEVFETGTDPLSFD